MKHKQKLFAILLTLGVASPMFTLSALAETTGTVQPLPVVQERADLQTQRADARQAIDAKKGEIKSENLRLRTDMKQKQDDLRKEIKDVRASTTREIRDERASTTREIKGMRNEIRGEEMKNRVDNTVKMLTANANRFDMLVTRIESRVSKIKSAGGNTTTIEAGLGGVKTSLVSVRSHITTITSIDLSGSSTTVRTNFEQVKTEAKAVKDIFQSIRQALDRIVNDIRVLEKTVKIKGEGRNNGSTTNPEPRQ